MVKELDRRQKLRDEQEAERLRIERARPSKERATEILNQVGFTPQRMAAVRAAPMARSMDEAVARSQADCLGPVAAAIQEKLDADPAVQRARGEP